MSIHGIAVSDKDGSVGPKQGYQFLFSGGDLQQMSAQSRFLSNQGFDVGSCNVYPAVKTEEDFKRGLELIWINKVSGWWNYRHQLTVQYAICTPDQFRAALG